MSIENEIQDLTQSTTDLLNAVNTKKVTLDNAVSQAQTAVTDATSQVSLAAAEKVGAQTARDEAESHKNQAYTYSQSAASAVAYQDLTAIAQTKAENAVDVFVYDTSKDSDGGAWRHRTQHTSWYNEPLNTSTRGSRKEFPAVAVIVAESQKVTIYDGDDPDLPMWMVFEGGIYNHVYSSSITSVTMLNGQLLVGEDDTSGAGALCWIDIIGDRSVGSIIFNLSTLHIALPISGRNSGTISDRVAAPTSYSIVNRVVNDVAMTVLPDAPIDPATQLPIPTIAVATDGGVSVIKDDGTVVDITHWGGSAYSQSDYIEFFEDRLVFTQDVDAQRELMMVEIPDQNVVISQSTSPIITTSTGRPSAIIVNSTIRNLSVSKVAGDSIVAGVNGYGFANVIDSPDYTETLFAKVASDYNTGWMNGDIKLATLSDTDDTDLVGSELVTNGTFDTDLSGWTETDTNNQMTPSHNAGALRMTSTGNTNNAVWMGQTITGLTVGQLYTVSADVTITGSANVSVILHSPYITSFPEINSSGVYSFTFKASSTTHEIRTYIAAGFTTGSTVDFDNVSLRVAEPDRSVNNNGLQVFGTVQKNPVATGADLMAYGPFSGSNYLEQPYNPDLDFGTGDLCIMGWLKTTDAYGIIFQRHNTVTPQGLISVETYPRSVNGLDFYLGGSFLSSTVAVNTGKWVNFVCVRRSGVSEIWINGKLNNTVANTNDLTPSSNDYPVRIGVRRDGQQTLEGSLALLRISATAPTAEQIKKIYEDEKVLFQENAKATLHGTSDAVTALAYDDTTELLHVGTSAGRSVFQGLRRVDNTTDAVGVAISASNGLVAEE